MIVETVKFKIHRANQQIGHVDKTLCCLESKSAVLEPQGFYVAFLRPNIFSINPFFVLRPFHIKEGRLLKVYRYRC